MTQLDPLVFDRLIQRLPLTPGPGLLDDLLRDVQGLGNPRNKGETGQVGRIRFGVEFGVSNQVPWGLTRRELRRSTPHSAP